MTYSVRVLFDTKNDGLVVSLIARVLAGEASEAERRRLDSWRRQCPSNEREYQEYVRTWRLAALDEAYGPVPAPPQFSEIADRGDRRRGQSLQLIPKTTRMLDSWRWIAAAAMGVLIVAVGAVFLETIDERGTVFAAGPHQSRTVALDDGSIVRLAPSSRIVVSADNQRDVELVGRAFFAVVPDSSRPFVVHARAGEVLVLGTRFEVSAGDDSLRIVVVEGRVDVNADGQQVAVSGGEVTYIARGSAPAAPRGSDVWKLLDWPEGLLLFQATPLADVIREIESHFGIPMAIRDRTLATRSVTAWFENETFDEVATTVCQVVGATCTFGDTVELTR